MQSKTKIKEIQGRFNGTSLETKDGEEYLVPPNYASKSMLVEGDHLKIYVQKDGSFIFKQVKPVPRKRLVCHVLSRDDYDKTVVADVSSGNKFNVLTSSATYFDLQKGDTVSCIANAKIPTQWIAVQNKIN